MLPASIHLTGAPLAFAQDPYRWKKAGKEGAGCVCGGGAAVMGNQDMPSGEAQTVVMNGCRQALGAWFALARVRDWSTSKIPFHAAGIFLLAPPVLPLFKSGLLLVVICAFFAFGYAINEVADRRCDRLAGKRNAAAELAVLSWLLFLLMAVGVTVGLSLMACRSSLVLWADAGAIMLAVCYSLPPLRLKERFFWGLASAAAVQWSFPPLLVAIAMQRSLIDPAVFCFAGLGFAIGMRWMAVHQYLDAAADLRSGVKTFATDGGSPMMVIWVAFAVELLALLSVIWLWQPAGLYAAGGLILWLVFSVVVHSPSLRLRDSLAGFAQAPLAEYYFFLLPLSLVASRWRDWQSVAVGLVLFYYCGRCYGEKLWGELRDRFQPRSSTT